MNPFERAVTAGYGPDPAQGVSFLQDLRSGRPDFSKIAEAPRPEWSSQFRGTPIYTSALRLELYEKQAGADPVAISRYKRYIENRVQMSKVSAARRDIGVREHLRHVKLASAAKSVGVGAAGGGAIGALLAALAAEKGERAESALGGLLGGAAVGAGAGGLHHLGATKGREVILRGFRKKAMAAGIDPRIIAEIEKQAGLLSIFKALGKGPKGLGRGAKALGRALSGGRVAGVVSYKAVPYRVVRRVGGLPQMVTKTKTVPSAVRLTSKAQKSLGLGMSTVPIKDLKAMGYSVRVDRSGRAILSGGQLRAGPEAVSKVKATKTPSVAAAEPKGTVKTKAPGEPKAPEVEGGEKGVVEKGMDWYKEMFKKSPGATIAGTAAAGWLVPKAMGSVLGGQQ